MTEGWRKQHVEELHDLYFVRSTIRMSKPKRTRWKEHVARRERTEMRARLWWETLKERGHLINLGVDERIILNIVGWVDWINLSQCENEWCALVNTVMNIRVTHNAGNLMTS